MIFLHCSGAGQNSQLLSELESRITQLQEAFPGIENEDAPTIGEGGSLAPFDLKSARIALSNASDSEIPEYTCLQNFFKCQLSMMVDGNVAWLHQAGAAKARVREFPVTVAPAQVPLRPASVNILCDTWYQSPSAFHGLFLVAVPPDWAAVPPSKLSRDSVRPLTPMEHILAFLRKRMFHTLLQIH